jgi:glycosyltransferase involved in cell wall biosynthesis
LKALRIGIDARKIADFGIGTYIRNLLRELVALGDEYVAFAPADAVLPAGVEHVVVDAPHYSVRELVAVGRAADRARLDLFHAPHYVVPLTRVPLVVTVHDLIHLRHPNPLGRLYARTMISRAVRKARRVLTVSETVRREIEATFGARNVVVAANGCDHIAIGRPGFSPATQNAGLKPGLPASYFLFVGNDKPHKNVDALVDAAQRIGTELVLVGASFARFRGRATLAGFVSDDDLAALYRGAIALVMPSREEGFGLPALEAMRCGTAVITSNAPALMEVTGDAALHVAANADALADAMSRLARDASLRASLIARGSVRASEFTWRRCATITRRAYFELPF